MEMLKRMGEEAEASENIGGMMDRWIETKLALYSRFVQIVDSYLD